MPAGGHRCCCFVGAGEGNLVIGVMVGNSHHGLGVYTYIHVSVYDVARPGLRSLHFLKLLAFMMVVV